jgi:hypothetical protein
MEVEELHAELMRIRGVLLGLSGEHQPEEVKWQPERFSLMEEYTEFF